MHYLTWMSNVMEQFLHDMLPLLSTRNATTIYQYYAEIVPLHYVSDADISPKTVDIVFKV